MLLAIQEPIRRSLQVRNCPHFFLSRRTDSIGATQAASTRAGLAGWKPAEPPGRLRCRLEKRRRENYTRAESVPKRSISRPDGLAARPRTTGTLQFRGVGVMKAIIQPREGEMAGYRPCKAQEKVKRERRRRGETAEGGGGGRPRYRRGSSLVMSARAYNSDPVINT